MAESIFKNWEDQLNDLKTKYENFSQELDNIRKALYNLNYAVANKPKGKIIHDDQRLVLSAPEIIIGDVNLAGILKPDDDCKSKIIIRGYNVSLEGCGALGKVETRATTITQTAENPGIDGTSHKVEEASSVCTQGCRVSINSCDVPAGEDGIGGVFLNPEVAGKGDICMKADNSISLTAHKSGKKYKDAVGKAVTDLTDSITNAKALFDNGLNSFQAKRKDFEKLLDEREKIDRDESALRTDYNDLDELNLRINEKSRNMASDFYEDITKGGELIELLRQKKYFDKLQSQVSNFNEEDYKKKTTGTSIALNSEKISLTSNDNDLNMRTNKEAEVKISANSVKIEGAFKDASFDESSEFSVNTRKVELSTAGKKGVERDNNSKLKKAEFAAEGDVIITSKNITMQAVNSEVKEGVFKENGLTPDGTINMRAMKIGLSTVNAKDVEVDKDGKITKATYTSEGDISILSKNVTMQSIDSKQEGEKIEETALTKDSKFSIRTEHFAMSATDKEGKATGTADINALKTSILSSDTDPKTGKAKDSAKGGKIAISAEKIENFGKEGASFTSDKNVEVLSKETALIQGEKTIEIKQDDSTHLSLTGSNSELSGKKNTLKGETTVNVLKSPSITGENVTVGTALKAPDLTVAVMVDKKDTSTSGSKLSGNLDGIKEEVKKVENIASMSNEDVNKQLPEMTKQKVTTSAKEEGFQNEEKKES